MKITIAQINSTIDDIAGNLKKLTEAWNQAQSEGASLCIASELVLQGYPAKDSLLSPIKHKEVSSAHKELKSFSKKCPGTALLFGSYVHATGFGLINAALLVSNGEVIVFPKKRLPDDDVFDESRYFVNEWMSVSTDCESVTTDCGIGTVILSTPVFELPSGNSDKSKSSHDSVRFGVSVCEDIWHNCSRKTFLADPLDAFLDSTKNRPIDVLINLSASPYTMFKKAERVNQLNRAENKLDRPVIYCNHVGATDDLIFDGGSGIFTKGDLKNAVYFSESIQTLSLNDYLQNGRQIDGSNKSELYKHGGDVKPNFFQLIQALSLGIKDYVKKSGFESVILGLSGGIDSALVAWLATYALGAEYVKTYTLPSVYSSKGSVQDSFALAKSLRISLEEISIEEMVDATMNTVSPFFKTSTPDFTEENIQARVRGIILMALSNKHGSLLLTTGNKSELAIGYSTIYGDMCGALNPIGDLLKTEVFQLCEFINTQAKENAWPTIPHEILEKPPSAELRPNQKDTDTLPPYPILDAIIHALVVESVEPSCPNFENQMAELILKANRIGKSKEKAKGHEAAKEAVKETAYETAKETIAWVAKKIKQNEYKRFQSPPILKVSKKAFGYGRRVTII